MKKTIIALQITLVFIIFSCGKDRSNDLPDNLPKKEIRVPQDYSTIQAAVIAADSDDIIILGPGTYNLTETVLVNKKITLTSEFINSSNESDVDKVIITSDNNLDPLILFQDGSEESICKGLTFQNALKQLTVECDYMDITHCKFFDSGSDALSFEGAGGYVGYNYFENCGDEAIDADNSLSWIVEYNEIINPNDDGLEIRMHNDNKAERLHIIRYNYISGAVEDGIQLIDYDGDSGRKFSIHHNVIVNAAMVGLGCTINGNTVEDFKGSYMEEEAYVYNNVFDNNKYGITGANNMLVFNNIISNSKDKAIAKLDNNSIADYNCFFNNITDFLNVEVGNNNIFEDPLFNADYSLQLNSVCIEAGTKMYTYNDLSQTVANEDLYGMLPDIGAKEYNGASLSNNPPTVFAGPNEVISTSEIQLLGEVSDDGLPSPGSLTYKWNLEENPFGGTVLFENENSKETMAIFSKQGSYDIKLTVSDGEKSRSDKINIYYAKDFNDNIIHLVEPIYIEAEDYRYLVGSAQVIVDSGASNEKIIKAESGLGTWAYTEYQLVTYASGTYYVWINASGADDSSNGLKAAFNNMANEVVFDGTTTNSFDNNSWVKLIFNNIPEGQYPLRIYATEEGVSWDRIFITMDINADPRL